MLLKTVLRFLPVLAVLFIAGCTPVLQEGMEHHIVAADYCGDPTFFDTADASGKVIRSGKQNNIRTYLAAMADNMAKSGRKKIMIYCFGGMNPLRDTLRVSERNTRIIMKESPDVYPVFINWDSELFGCYLEDLLVVRHGVADYWMGPPTAPLLFVTHILEAICRLPGNMFSQTIGVDDGTDVTELYAQLPDVLKKCPTELNWYLGKDRSDHRWMALSRAGYRTALPFRVLTTGLIDSFGSRGWREMRRRARLCFSQEPDLTSPLDGALNILSAQADGVFSLFAEMLIDYARKHPDTEITLIGHCMGTLIVTEFLSRYPELRVRNIVFMAGASSAQETAAVIKPYLINNPESHFYNLCLHPYVDWFDMIDYCVLPCGSVLNWVNQHLTEPISKEDYTVGMWVSAMISFPRMMRGVEKQVTIKAFGIQDPAVNVGAGDLPHQHTDFSNPASGYWKPEFWKVPAAAKTPPPGPLNIQPGASR